MNSPYLSMLKKDKKPRIQSLADDLKARNDPDFFWATGTQVYCGRQGSGKTISAVKHLMDLKKRYPKSIIVSNIHINTLEKLKYNTKDELNQLMIFLKKRNDEKQYNSATHYIEFSSMEQLILALEKVNNNFNGVVYLIDEIHTYFNALDSKNVPMSVFTEISQQRKQRKLIIGTSQLFLRMAKPFREQCDNLIMCKTYFGFLTTQTAYDGMELTTDFDGNITATRRKMGWFYHTRELRKTFDTYQKVVSQNIEFEQPITIMEPKKTGLFGTKRK